MAASICEQATPVLKAGKRLYIGRPLAASLEDAVAIMKLAEQTKTPCWTSSQHRFSPGFIGMRNHPEVGKVLGCDVYGGCPTEPHPCRVLLARGARHRDALHHHGARLRVGPLHLDAVRRIDHRRLGRRPGRHVSRHQEGGAQVQRDGVRRQGGVGRRHLRPWRAGEGRSCRPTTSTWATKGIAIEMAKFFKGGPAPVTRGRDAGALRVHGSGPRKQTAKRSVGARGGSSGEGAKVINLTTDNTARPSRNANGRKIWGRKIKG